MRLQNLDLNLLVLFDQMLNGSSVGRAAEEFRVTQSAISNALARLRAHFDDPLFVQVGRRLEPTPFAASLAESVRVAVGQLSDIAVRRSAFDPAIEERTFRIICSDYSFQVFLTKAVRKLAEIAPGLKTIAVLTDGQSPALLNGGRTDFVVLPVARSQPDHPNAPLFSETFSCICWSESPLAKGALSLEKYLELHHVSTCLGLSNPPHIEQDSLDAQGLARKIAVFAPNFTSICEAVIGTNYIATVHSRLAEMYADRLPIKVFSPPVKIDGFVEVLQWHRNSSGDPGIMWMRDFLVRCAAEI